MVGKCSQYSINQFPFIDLYKYNCFVYAVAKLVKRSVDFGFQSNSF